ncbi:hypothetical protein LTR37_020320 [Vermiconidia calcicola]|uniref:Uncharacterized protein n=1 Tax=Vermiconidia calcicola TaxID=1690605 RepID=A0ACC3MD51_9PEZI|nr:hypothetical protein LTR37_020320 [Vermiconidia calcicola]
MAERNTRSKGTSANNDQDSDAHRAKKRAWDRTAQRKRRERTKIQLDHLQETIRILRSDDQATRITELMAEIEKLRAENQRLRGIMANSAKLLQSGRFAPDCRDGEDDDDEAGGLSAQANNTPDTVANEDQCIVTATTSAGSALIGHGVEEPATTTSDPYIFSFLTGGEGPAMTIDASLAYDDFFAAFERCVARSPNSYNTMRTPWDQWHSPSNGSLNASASLGDVASAGPADDHANFHRLMPSAISSRAAWQTVNRIFDTIFQVDVYDALAADTVDAGPLLKGIDVGWDACGRAIERSPTIHILSQMDKCVWSTLPKSSRAAIAYKSYMLLRYLLNPSHRNLLSMPEWERPTTLQQTTDHPIAINFFPWPALRERLILNQDYYINTCNFFVQVVSEFEFRWPYSYDDTYVVERHTGEYRASPRFVEHVRDLENWTMKESFFDSFPEFRSDVCLPDTTISRQPIAVS